MSPSVGIAAPDSKEGIPVEVTGTILYQTFLFGSNRYSAQREFRVNVNRCSWLIHTTAPGTGDSLEIGYEDGDLCSIKRFSRITNGVRTNTIVAQMEAHDIPEADTFLASYLWLAYASPCYLSGLSDEMMEPVWPLDDPTLRYERYKASSRVRTLEHSSGLPSDIVFLSDGQFLLRKQDGSRHAITALPPYDRGFTNAIYQVLSVTNIDRFSFPVAFLFTRYAVGQAPGSSSNTLFVRSTALVTNATIAFKAPLSSYLPTFEGDLPYFERRFTQSVGGSAVPRTAYAGRWPKSAPQIAIDSLRYFGVITNRVTARGGARILPYWAGLGFFAASTLILVLFLRHTLKSNRQK